MTEEVSVASIVFGLAVGQVQDTKNEEGKTRSWQLLSSLAIFSVKVD